jgi:hypothetical protein
MCHSHKLRNPLKVSILAIRISLNGHHIDKEYENGPKCLDRKLFFERKDHRCIILNFAFNCELRYAFVR